MGIAIANIANIAAISGRFGNYPSRGGVRIKDGGEAYEIPPARLFKIFFARSGGGWVQNLSLNLNKFLALPPLQILVARKCWKSRLKVCLKLRVQNCEKCR